MTRRMHVALGVVTIGLVALAGTSFVQGMSRESAPGRHIQQDSKTPLRLAQAASAEPAPGVADSTSEVNRLRRLTERLQKMLAVYVREDLQAQTLQRLQDERDQAVQQQEALQAQIEAMRAEYAPIDERIARYRLKIADLERSGERRQVDLTRAQQRSISLQEELTKARSALTQARDSWTAARSHSQRLQVQVAELMDQQEAQQAAFEQAQVQLARTE